MCRTNRVHSPRLVQQKLAAEDRRLSLRQPLRHKQKGAGWMSQVVIMFQFVRAAKSAA